MDTKTKTIQGIKWFLILLLFFAFGIGLSFFINVNAVEIFFICTILIIIIIGVRASLKTNITATNKPEKEAVWKDSLHIISQPARPKWWYFLLVFVTLVLGVIVFAIFYGQNIIMPGIGITVSIMSFVALIILLVKYLVSRMKIEETAIYENGIKFRKLFYTWKAVKKIYKYKTPVWIKATKTLSILFLRHRVALDTKNTTTYMVETDKDMFRLEVFDCDGFEKKLIYLKAPFVVTNSKSKINESANNL